MRFGSAAKQISKHPLQRLPLPQKAQDWPFVHVLLGNAGNERNTCLDGFERKIQLRRVQLRKVAFCLHKLRIGIFRNHFNAVLGRENGPNSLKLCRSYAFFSVLRPENDPFEPFRVARVRNDLHKLHPLLHFHSVSEPERQQERKHALEDHPFAFFAMFRRVQFHPIECLQDRLGDQCHREALLHEVDHRPHDRKFLELAYTDRI